MNCHNLTYYDENSWVEVFDGCSCTSQQTVLSSCRNHHCVQFGYLLIDLHAHGAQSCQVRCALISGHLKTQTRGRNTWGERLQSSLTISFRKFTFVTSTLISAMQWRFYYFLVTDRIHAAAISPWVQTQGGNLKWLTAVFQVECCINMGN